MVAPCFPITECIKIPLLGSNTTYITMTTMTTTLANNIQDIHNIFAGDKSRSSMTIPHSSSTCTYKPNQSIKLGGASEIQDTKNIV